MDEQPDPDELRQRAQHYDELCDSIAEIRELLDRMARSEVVDERTQHRVEFLKEMLNMVQHGEDWAYAAHYARHRAKEIEQEEQ